MCKPDNVENSYPIFVFTDGKGSDLSVEADFALSSVDSTADSPKSPNDDGYVFL